jgi:RNA polymerase sigma-70 factor (ECF subfamily)
MTARHDTDEELMICFQGGDACAFDQLYRRYRGPVFSFVLRFSSAPDRAADLTQETFLRLVRSGGGFRHGSRVATWIFTIARNVAIDASRRQQHRRHQSLDQPTADEGRPLSEQIHSEEPLADRGVISERLKKDLSDAIETLPEEQKEVFLLREYHGLSFKEIAEVVGAKEGTIKSRMRYALEALRRALSPYEDYARTLQ